jgi:hypothetical protein
LLGSDARAGLPCGGDCDANGAVSVDELVLAVDILLGIQPVSACLSADVDGTLSVTIDEVTVAVTNALTDCP